jgi:hypothetical protein
MRDHIFSRASSLYWGSESLVCGLRCYVVELKARWDGAGAGPRHSSGAYFFSRAPMKILRQP